MGLVAQTPDRFALAGDNLIVDLNLSASNLPTGQRLAIGQTIIEIRDVPHTVRKQFFGRYEQEARDFINAHESRELRLRGIHGRVIKAGMVRVGDAARKV